MNDSQGNTQERFSILFRDTSKWLSVFGLIVFLIGAYIFYMRNATSSLYTTLAPQSVVRPIDESDHVIGNKDAELFLIVYLDAECPYCKLLHQSVVPRLLEAYRGQLLVAYRHFPLKSRAHALEGSEAWECAYISGGEDSFWKYIDHLYTRSRSDGTFDLALLRDIPKAIPEIDQLAFNRCVSLRETRERIRRDSVEGAVAGISLTPSVIVGRGTTTVLVAGSRYAPIKTAIELLKASQ